MTTISSRPPVIADFDTAVRMAELYKYVVSLRNGAQTAAVLGMSLDAHTTADHFDDILDMIAAIKGNLKTTSQY
jgi:hypothetical protein